MTLAAFLAPVQPTQETQGKAMDAAALKREPTDTVMGACDQLLAELAETRKKFERFDALGDKLTNGLSRVLKQAVAANAASKKVELPTLTEEGAGH